MYNRYIPGNNGHYERRTVEVPKQELPCPTEVPSQAPEKLCPPSKPCPSVSRQSGMDLGDLLLLCVVALLLLDSEEEDMTTLLITAAAFLFLQ